MTNKSSRWAFALLAILVALILGFCQNKEIRKKLCNDVCDTNVAAKPEIFRLVNRTSINGVFRETSGSKLYAMSEDGDLVVPGDVTWERAPGSDVFVEQKRQGLDKACFSETNFPVTTLDNVTLDASDVTITVLNFDDDGRVESYDLEAVSGGYPAGLNSIFGQPGNYGDIQTYLSTSLNRNQMTPGNNGNIRVRAKGLSGMTDENTPFDESLTAQSDEKGHVTFYVLADSKLTFNRGPFAMISYAPAADNAIGSLYTPYTVYPVKPDFPQNNPAVPEDEELDVLVIHFKRGGTMFQGPDSLCEYPYDLAVIAEGQNGVSPKTPMLIDPKIGTNGPFP